MSCLSSPLTRTRTRTHSPHPHPHPLTHSPHPHPHPGRPGHVVTTCPALARGGAVWHPVGHGPAGHLLRVIVPVLPSKQHTKQPFAGRKRVRTGRAAPFLRSLPTCARGWRHPGETAAAGPRAASNSTRRRCARRSGKATKNFSLGGTTSSCRCAPLARLEVLCCGVHPLTSRHTNLRGDLLVQSVQQQWEGNKLCPTPSCAGFLSAPYGTVQQARLGKAAEVRCSQCLLTYCWTCASRFHYGRSCGAAVEVTGRWLRFLRSVVEGEGIVRGSGATAETSETSEGERRRLAAAATEGCRQLVQRVAAAQVRRVGAQLSAPLCASIPPAALPRLASLTSSHLILPHLNLISPHRATPATSSGRRALLQGQCRARQPEKVSAVPPPD